MSKTVIKRDGTEENFDIDKIYNAIRKAYKAANPDSNNVDVDAMSAHVCKAVRGEFVSNKPPHVEAIQDEVERAMMGMDSITMRNAAKAFILYRAEHKSIRAGKLATDIIGTYLDKSDWRVFENSNSGYCYASLMNHVSGTMIANYCLENVYERDVAQAHINGDIHIHDLSAGVVGYCAGHSLKDLLFKGFIGKYGRANAGPAKHLDTAFLQAANFLCTLQTEWAGAQAFNSFDTLMAPFVRVDNLTYEEVKQRMQQFVFGLNIASRYGQCVPATTKCLKADGTWVNYENLKIGDKIMVYDINTCSVTNDIITHVLNKPFAGKMHRYTSKNNYSFTVTPDHRVVYFTNNVPSITESSNLIGKKVNISCADFKHFSAKKNVECTIKEEDFDGIVWCPTTNTGTFIAKDENGTVFITGNCPFTNLTFDLSCPNDMKDQPVIIGGVPHDTRTYGEFQTEMDMINKAFIEVMMDGDHDHRIFSFPIPTYNITKDFPWDSEVAKLLFKMTGKYGAPYFQNFINSDLDPSDVRSMCCRLRLDLENIRKHTGGLFGAGDQTGSIGVVSISIPRIAYECKDVPNTEDRIKEFYRLLNIRLNWCKSALEAKRIEINKNLENGLMPYTKEYLPHKFTRHFSTIGVIGFNEACEMMFHKNMGDQYSIEFVLKVLNYILEKCKEFTDETGNMYNLEAVPGEGLTYRFAKIDKKKCPGIITAGTDDSPYYTNSSQLPVNYTEDPFEALEKQDVLQSTYSSGTVLHFFMGECIEDENLVAKFVKSVCERSKIPYFSLTPTFSICPKCGYLVGAHEYCPNHVSE